MDPAYDAETVENNGEVTNDVVPFIESPGYHTFCGNICRDYRFINYTVNHGSMFAITTKYTPPIVPIGRGAYGIVCAATNSETKKKVAIKKITNAFKTIIDAKKTLREIRLLCHFAKVETIVGIKDVILPRDRHSYEDVYIVCELMDTDLFQVIRADDELDRDHINWYMYDILRALKYIHSANVIHRDLKPSNILLNWNISEVKICDFGLARSISERDIMTEYVVTRWYRAPELLLSCRYTEAIDIWSAGCIFMEMMTRRQLFPGKDQLHQLRLQIEFLGTPSEEELGSYQEPAKRYILSLPFYPRQSFSEKFPNADPVAIDLVEKMLTFDPKQRISAKDALAHPYFDPLRNIDDEADALDEPECSVPFNFDLGQHDELTVEHIKELIYNEALSFYHQAKQ